MNKEEFIISIKELGIELTEEQLVKLNKFYNLLIEWNEKINLTRITEEKEVYLKHFYDSLTISKVVDLSTKETLCDVGTGAGFPGIVLKIVFPNLKIDLLDSTNKGAETLINFKIFDNLCSKWSLIFLIAIKVSIKFKVSYFNKISHP